jgi:DNA-nicking Smr family endonuclease
MAAWKYNPFAVLARAAKEKQRAGPAAPTVPSAKSARPPPRVEAGPSFRELMESVEPLPQAPSPLIPLLGGPSPARFRAGPRTRLWIDEEHGHVRAAAADAAPSVLGELQRGATPPRSALDLHGLGAAEAKERLSARVRTAREQGISCLLVVVGRGLHSDDGGPVLPDVVIQHLSENLADSVLAFCTAPRRWGGLGALLVRLRPLPSRDASVPDAAED